MSVTFVYALPANTTLQQEAVISRGLRGLFPDVQFDYRPSDFAGGGIVQIVGRSSAHDADEIIMNPPPQLLVQQVRAAFQGLLVQALAGPRVCAGCGD